MSGRGLHGYCILLIELVESRPQPCRMAEGRSNMAIAARLNLSPKTLESHIRRILQRLGLEDSPDDHRRVLAVLEYLRAPR
jgi:DNA-binding NarL/FixJ family response regulator